MAADTIAPTVSTAAISKEIAFIDTSVSDYQRLVQHIQPGVEVVLIDGAQDGLAQIAAALAGRSGLEAVHLFSHGAAGLLQVGSTRLTLANMDEHAAGLAAIRSALGEQGDLLIYGCDVAQGEAGAAFVAALAQATGADVAASSDATGSTLLNADWVLEARHGAIEAQAALLPAGQAAFGGLLAASANFNSLGFMQSYGNSFTAGGWTFSTVGGAQFGVANINELGRPINNDGPGDRAVFLNVDGVDPVSEFRMKASDSSSFQMVSMQIGHLVYGGTNVTITGYRGGSQVVAGETINLTANDPTGSVTYTVGPSDGNARMGVLSFGSLYSNVDEIRFVFNSVAEMQIDDISVSAAVLPDTTPPAVSGNIAVPANGSYRTGQMLNFTVSFDENVTVTGTNSTLGLTIGSTARSAAYASKTANSITYTYTVQAGDNDADGIAIGSLALGGSTIRDAAGNNANLSLTGHLPSTTGVLVDTVAPAVSGHITVPSNGIYGTGQVLSFTVGFDENVTVIGTDSTLGLTIGATARSAVYASKTANSITYTYTVQAGDSDADGIGVGSLGTGTSTIRDAAGNSLNPSMTGHVPSMAVLVDTTAPSVSGNLAVPANATYVIGQNLDFTITFDENVTVTGTDSALGLTVGATARSASFLSASGNTVTYRYTVQAGDVDVNGITVGALALGSSTVRDAAGNNASLSLAGHVPSTAGVLVDALAPSVGSVATPSNATYVAGQNLDFTITFDENVTVTGTDSTLGLTVGASARSAGFVSQTANSITYRYTVQAGDVDANGITVGSLGLGTSTIRDATGNNANLSLTGHVSSTAGVLVDALAPSVASVAAPSNAAYVAGQNLDFTVTFDENVSVTGTDSTLGLTIGATARSAAFVSQTANSITYRYTVQAGDLDADGIAIGALALGTSTIRDAAGNNASLSLAGHLPSTAAVLVDAVAPSVAGTVSVPANGSYVVGQVLSFTVGFDENVTVSGTDSTLGLTIGSTARTASYASKTANSITYTYTVQAGDNDADGIAIGSLALGTSTIRDAAGNNANLSLTGHLPSTAAVLVDTAAPAVSGNLAVPAAGTYVVGQNLDFTLSFDENVTVTGTNSALGLTIGSTAVNAMFLSASGNTVTYRYTVQAGDLDANGITVGSLALNTSTIRDGAGNNANLSLSGHVPSTAGVLVDALAPSVAGVAAPSNATYVAGQNLDFTITFGENVTVTGTDSTFGLVIGSTARGASFLSASGNTVTYRYTVQAGDNDANGIGITGFTLGTSTIKDATGNNANLSLLGHVPSTSGVRVDALAPAVSGNIAVPANGSYMAGQVLSFTVSFDETVTVSGTDSTLGLTIGSTARSATFASKTASSITYTYTVQAGDLDADGIAIGGLALGTSTVRDAAGNNANLSLTGHLPTTTGVLVDALAPAVSGNIAVPANGNYMAGQVLSFTVSFDENVTVTGTDSTLGLTLGSTARSASFASKTANSITYTYTVQAGDLDADGIAIGSLSLGTSTIRDAAGNNANLSLAGHVPSTGGVLADALAPGVSGNIAVPSNATHVAGQNLDFTLSFDENVTVTGTDSALGLTIGSTARSATFLSASGNTVTYRYTVQAGDVDANGITVGSLALGTSIIRDGAGNDANLSLTGHLPATSGVLVDALAPSVTNSVAVPSNATYVAGQNLDFTVSFDEAVTVTGTDSALGLTIGSTARSASFLSASGNTVTYRYVVQAGDLDADGIAIGSLVLGSSTIRDAAGNDASLSLASHLPSTTGVRVDAVAPVVTGTIAVPADATYVAGQVLSFTVSFDESVVLTGTDSTLGLTIGSTARTASYASKTANSITYTYTVQAGDNDADGIAIGALSLGTSTIRDAAGNNANLALTGHLPSTAVVRVDTIAPAFVDAAVNGATLVMSYTESALLDTAHVPAAGAFSVNAAGTAIAVTAVAVNAAAHTVTLTLAAPVASGQAVTVAYADPTAGNDANALQDAAGNDAASLAATAVLNNTPAPVLTRPVTVDGVVLQVGTRVNTDGSVSQVLTIPVVTPSRVEEVGNNTVADIPLAAAPDGTSIVNAQVPIGFGMTVSGSAATGTAGSSLTDLIREIKAHTAPGSQDQNQLTGGGSGFLADLAPSTPLQVLTIAPTVSGNSPAPTGSLVISGAPALAGNPYTALVIDTRALPANSTIELHEVEFAAVIGAVRVTGGSGSQNVWGDSSSQDIMLGADDDILHGGGGNDIVGSAGGNDRIFGDEGDDVVFGGAGNDHIDGGTGKDVVLLAGANRAEYSLRVADGKLVMTHLHGGSDGIDLLANVETLRFSNAAADTSVYGTVTRLVEAYTGARAELTVLDAMVSAAQKGATLSQVAQTLYGLSGGANAGLGDEAYIKLLYQNVFHRAADSGGVAFWNGKLAAGMSRADVALAFANSAEKLGMQPADLDFNASDVATLVRMYDALFDRKADTAGLNYWIASHEAGKSMADIADAFVAGAEMSSLHGTMNNAQFVAALYQSALHRQATSAEAGFWVDQLDKGQLDRGDVLLGFANSAEKIGLVGMITTSIETF